MPIGMDEPMRSSRTLFDPVSLLNQIVSETDARFANVDLVATTGQSAARIARRFSVVLTASDGSSP